MKAVVRLRGEVDTSSGVEDTLSMLNLHAVNHCTFVPETDAYRGMLTKVHDHVAVGEPSVGVVEELLAHRGEPAEGDATIDDEWVAEHTEYDDLGALAAALVDEETTLRDVGLSPALRLHPPRKGHEGIKHPAGAGGQLGGHDPDAIDDLLEAMR